MKTQIVNIADEINREHSLAMNHADRAIDHAKRAGALLLQVKNSLPHGEFLPWLAANITVSVRQSQRYIRAALGKPMPVRAIANTTPVSDLDWLPKSPALALVNFDDGDLLEMQESADHRGFFFVACVSGDLSFTIKPIHSSFVEQVIFDWLPGKHTRDCGIRNLQWEIIDDAPPYFVKDFIEPHLPEGYEHLRRNKHDEGSTL